MDLLHSLKVFTQPVHREIEQLELFKKIMTRELTLQEYKQLVSYLYGFIYSREKKIQIKNQNLLSGREKSHLLHSDLVKLQCDIEKISLYHPASTDLNTTADILGYLYVMEGATLGGQVILKSLTNNPQLPPGLATHYFNAYGNQTNEKWHAFTQLLSTTASHPNEQTYVIQISINTFTSLYLWLQGEI